MFSGSLYAQNYLDVVYLKNGSIIRGIIIEQIPSESLKIQTNDGNVFVFSIEEVSKLAKEQTTTMRTRQRIASQFDNYNRIQIGYNPVYFSTEDENYDLHGLSIEWVNGINLTYAAPIYLEVGANATFAFRQVSEQFEQANAYYIGASIPVTFSYKLDTNLLSISPYIGLNNRINLLFKEDYQYIIDREKFTGSVNLLEEGGKHFCPGFTCGVNFISNNFSMGCGYVIDFVNVHSIARLSNWSIKLGFTF